MNFLTNQTPANWRNYSPGGKRKKMVHIPFMGQQNNDLRAMGTKRVPVLANKFSYAYMNTANFAIANTSTANIQDDYVPSPPPFPFSRKVKYKYLTTDEKRQLTPEQREVLMNQERDQDYLTDSQESRANSRSLRANYRTVLETGREARGWLRTLNPLS